MLYLMILLYNKDEDQQFFHGSYIQSTHSKSFVQLMTKSVKAEVISSQLAPQNVCFQTGLLNIPPVFNWTNQQKVPPSNTKSDLFV